MAKIKGAMQAAILLACLLPACTREPPNFVMNPPPAPKPTDGSQAPETFEAADAACKEETRKKGIKSVTAIFSRLRPGQAERDYIACMRDRGFEVPGAPASPSG